MVWQFFVRGMYRWRLSLEHLALTLQSEVTMTAIAIIADSGAYWVRPACMYGLAIAALTVQCFASLNHLKFCCRQSTKWLVPS